MQRTERPRSYLPNQKSRNQRRQRQRVLQIHPSKYRSSRTTRQTAAKPRATGSARRGQKTTSLSSRLERVMRARRSSLRVRMRRPARSDPGVRARRRPAIPERSMGHQVTETSTETNMETRRRAHPSAKKERLKRQASWRAS